MTTRAANIQFLISGVTSATTGEPVEGGSVEFYESGTTTQKYVWTEREKTNGYYSYDLDAVGSASLFGEGEYKIIIKDSSGATVATLDPVRLEHPYYGIRTVTSGSVTMVSQDDFILCDTSSGAITINCLAASSWTRPLKIMRISGTNSVTIDPNGSETIGGSSTLAVTSDAIVEIISNGSNLLSAGFRSEVSDSDNDTKITFEEESDEDIINFYAGGNKVLQLYKSGPHYVYVSGSMYVSGPFSVYGRSVVGSPTLVYESGGSPSVATNEFSLFGNVTKDSWKSFGPTDSGADHEWSALDDIPVGVDWIILKIKIGGDSTTGGGSTDYASLYARDNGSGATNDTISEIANARGRIESGVGYAGNITMHPVPVTNRMFDLYWESEFTDTTYIDIVIIGYGYNS